MRWLLPVLLLMPLFVPAKVRAAVESASLECTEKKPGKIPDWVPDLQKYADKTLTISITRKAAVIAAEGVRKANGNAKGALPTETYEIGSLGKEGKLVLASAGAYLGAQNVIVYLKAKGRKPGTAGESVYTVELKCKNNHPGEVVSFIKLCTEAPQVDEVTCNTKIEETVGMPKTFSFKSSGNEISVTYEDPSDKAKTVTEPFKFVPNENPPMNSTIKLIEFCHFAIRGRAAISEFSELRVSRPLAEKGAGLASIPVKEREGGASILYQCAK